MLQIEINKKTIYIYTLLQTQCSQICTWYKLNHDGYDCNNSCLERMQCKNQHLTEILTVLIIANEQRQHNFTRQITSTKDLNWGTWELQTYVMYTNRTPVQILGLKTANFLMIIKLISCAYCPPGMKEWLCTQYCTRDDVRSILYIVQVTYNTLHQQLLKDQRTSSDP